MILFQAKGTNKHLVMNINEDLLQFTSQAEIHKLESHPTQSYPLSNSRLVYHNVPPAINTMYSN